MSDLIDRQSALKAIDEYEKLSMVSQTVRNMTSLKEIVEKLPSAQPEIIRCKDCRWHNGKINQCNAQICASMYGDDFCSRAERKGGD